MSIPRIVHHVWPGPDPIPYTFRANMATFADWNPDWEHRLWTESDLDGLRMVNRDLYDRAKEDAPDDWLRWRADIARLEIVYQYGGIYVDTDAECLRPLDDLLEYEYWFAESPNAPGYATQAVFAAGPHHPFLRGLLEGLESSAQENRGKRINHRVGSRFVARNTPKTLPWQWFAAQSITDRDAGRRRESNGYIDHKYFNTDRHRNSKAQVDAFKAAADILNAAGVEWFLTSGLLLGHIREGRILPWDLDVDLGIWPEGVEPVRRAFRDAGWPFRRDFDSQMWPVHRNTKIDIHTHHRDGDTVYKLHGKQQKIRMDHPAYLFNLQPSLFYLRDVLIPSPPEDYLEVMYGPDWLTPKKEWRWDQDPRNITSR